ncbi:MAG: hypothetical protein LBC47_07105 [Tannerella sp.]|nr:hypothetical protein [Tannerella sp.]
MEEIGAALKAVREGKWDEFVKTHPHVSGKPEKPQEPAVIPSQSSQQTTSVPKVEQQPLMTLYDLFGFSAEERKQLNTKKKGIKKSVATLRKPVQLNLFAQPQANVQSKTGETPQTQDETSKHYNDLKEKHPNTLVLL